MTKILLVEDDPLMLRMYQKVLRFGGYEVEAVDNGEEGLEKARSGKPSLILLDIMMPKMDGLQVLEELKKDQSTKDIPVVILTSLVGTDDAKKALSMGAVKYLIKSEYDPNKCLDMVKEYVSGEKKEEKKAE